MFLSGNGFEKEESVDLPPGTMVDADDVSEFDTKPRKSVVSRSQEEAMERLQRQRELEAKRRASKKAASGMMMATDVQRTSSGLSRTSSSGGAAMRRGSVDSSDSSDSDDQVSPIQEVERSKKPFATMSEIEKKMQRAGMSSTYDPTEGTAVATKIPKTVSPALDVSDIVKFLQTPVPPGRTIQCYIRRVKRGLKKVFPTYNLYLADGDRFLLAARKRKKNKTANYLISRSDENLSRKDPNYMGKVRANFLGLSFSVFDNGSNPSHPTPKDGKVRQEYAAVTYETNVLGTKGPRKMTVLCPRLVDGVVREEYRPMREADTLIERYKANDIEDLVVLGNKKPKWSENMGAYCLNFSGRVTVPSVKNFQLVTEEDGETIALQFGKVKDDEFTMDFAHPLCAMQAFGVCLTSFDNKLACE